MRLVDSRGGAQEEKLIGGVQQLSEGLAKAIGMEHVVTILRKKNENKKMKSPVRKIVQEVKEKETVCHVFADNPNDDGKSCIIYKAK